MISTGKRPTNLPSSFLSSPLQGLSNPHPVFLHTRRIKFLSLSQIDTHTFLPSQLRRYVNKPQAGRGRGGLTAGGERRLLPAPLTMTCTHIQTYTHHMHTYTFIKTSCLSATPHYTPITKHALYNIKKNQMLSHKDIITIELLIHPCTLSDISLKRTHRLFRDVH